MEFVKYFDIKHHSAAGDVDKIISKNGNNN